MSPSHLRRRRGPAAARGLAILIALTFAAGAGAARANSALGGGPFGLAPSPTSAGRPRSYFDLTVPPGQSARDTAVLSNTGSRPERLKISVSNGVTAANSGSAYQSVPVKCAGPTCWVTGLPTTVSLAPHERRALAFRVAVPEGTPARQYLTGVTAEPAVPPPAVEVGSNGRAAAKAIIVNKVTVGVAIAVGSLSHMRTALAIKTVSAGWAGTTPRLSIPVNNFGQTFAKATGAISCKVGGRDHSYRVIMRTVLPGDHAALPVNAPGLHSGRIPCTIHLDDGSGHPVIWSGIVDLPSRTHTKIIHTGDGTYSALPENTIPTWAIALIVIGVLILAALLTLLVLHRRNNRKLT